MTIKPLASGSGGNAYLLGHPGLKPLLLDCGLKYKELNRRSGYVLHDIAGCLVTHEHKDHCRAMWELGGMGIKCHMSEGTARAISFDTIFERELTSDQSAFFGVPTIRDVIPFIVDGWTVKPFSVVHDAAEPLGFLIKAGDDVCLYLTDSAVSPVRFGGLTHMIVECNYVRSILDANVEAGRVSPALRRRIIQSHMSLETLCELLEANDLSRLREIWVAHLSNDNSDEALIVRTLQQQTGIPVYACEE